MRSPARGLRTWARVVFAAVAASALAGLALSPAQGGTLAGFEVDADDANIQQALYAGGAGDWVSAAGQGVFAPGGGGVTGCYGSDVTVNPASGGLASFLCDGSSDSRFDGNGGDSVVEPEANIVSPGGKQIADVWNIKTGGVTAKDDFSHAYSFFRFADSSCDADTDADDPFMALGGHRGDNEGDAFWGFELDDIGPTGFSSLTSNGGTTFDLDFNRTPGDLLISFTLVGGGTNPLLEVYRWDGATFVLAPASCVASPGAAQGDSLLRTNPTGDILAPPWNLPVCDPTATNGANTCRIVNASGTAPAAPGDNRIAPRDFTEAMIDFSAFGVANMCFSSLIFTSRSAHPLETADLKDVGGVPVDTCPQAAPPPAAPPPANPPGGLPPVRLPPTGGPLASTTDYAVIPAVIATITLVVCLSVLIRSRRR